jgi:N-acetylglucosaminyldiphosphoundecaprenol N-acetyl-beta-D-mannosaminyltransferase
MTGFELASSHADAPPTDAAHAHAPGADVPCADVLGVKVSAIDLNRAVQLADDWIVRGRPGYICVTGVHGVMEAQTDAEFRGILNNAAINTPDGMPMTWVGRLQGFAQMDRVFGPDFMAALCQLSVERGYRNFFYGGKPGVAELLEKRLRTRFPGLQAAGIYTPPFGDLSTAQEQEVCERVRAARPHIVWVGLSTPRQERFMAQFVDRLQAPLLVGVGAAFDYHTGQIQDSPTWVKRAGLQWLHRLMQDPRRLWRRYLRNNPAFLWHIARQFAGVRYPPGNKNGAHGEARGGEGIAGPATLRKGSPERLSPRSYRRR